MDTTSKRIRSTDSRRRFLTTTATTAVACAIDGNFASSEAGEQKERTVRDRLWIFACVAGADNEGWNLPQPSRMTPAEGAYYLGVPNLLLIRWQNQPPMPFDQYAIALRPLKRVVWSMVGYGGKTGQAKIVRDAQAKVAKTVKHVACFNTDDCPIVDPVKNRGHYNAAGLIEIGKRFAAGYKQVIDRKKAKCCECGKCAKCKPKTPAKKPTNG